MAVRITLSLVVLFSVYFFIPTKQVGSEQSDVPYVLLELLIFGAVVAFQVPAIVKAKYPILRAVEALTLVIAFYLLIFARIYLSNSLSDPGVFNHPLNHTTALYFTVTVFATVGFGDIVAATDGMRGLVTVQMLLNLVVLGLIIRLLSSAAQRGVARHRSALPASAADGPAVPPIVTPPAEPPAALSAEPPAEPPAALSAEPPAEPPAASREDAPRQ
ncbi:potassium channel family protein [Nakamurella sp. GG22]